MINAIIFSLVLIFSCGAIGQEIVTRPFSLKIDGGLELQGRLDAPAGKKNLPTIIILQGAGPLNVDMAMLEMNNPQATCYSKNWKNDCRVDKHLAQELASLGFAVIRLGKRGVWVDDATPSLIHVDYSVNATSTLTNRMKDLDILLNYLPSLKEVNPSRLHVIGVSEGTIIAQKAMPLLKDRLKSLVLVGAVLTSGTELYRTQIVDTAYNLLLRAADENQNGVIEEEEYNLNELMNASVNSNSYGPTIRKTLIDLEQNDQTPTFPYFDLNSDGFISRVEMQQKIYKNLFYPIHESVMNNQVEVFDRLVDEDFSFKYNTMDQFRDWFLEPSHADLLSRTQIPATIFFGDDDLNTSPRQLDWFLPMVWKENNPFVKAQTVPGGGHYGPRLAEEIIKIYGSLGL